MGSKELCPYLDQEKVSLIRLSIESTKSGSSVSGTSGSLTLLQLRVLRAPDLKLRLPCSSASGPASSSAGDQASGSCYRRDRQKTEPWAAFVRQLKGQV